MHDTQGMLSKIQWNNHYILAYKCINVSINSIWVNITRRINNICINTLILYFKTMSAIIPQYLLPNNNASWV